MIPCRACKLVHSAMVRCEVAAHFAKMALAVVDAQKPVETGKEAKTGLRIGSESDEREAGNTLAPPVSPANRHPRRPGYQRDLMRVRRAIASGRAERYPRTVN